MEEEVGELRGLEVGDLSGPEGLRGGLVGLAELIEL
jgi:hypothetical protein